MTAQQAARQGRKPAQETALQVIEGSLYGIGAEAIHGRESLIGARLHDANADESVRRMREIGRRLALHADPAVCEQGHALIALADEYGRHDDQEDARVHHGEYRFGMVLTEVRTGCGAVELAETGAGRHRPKRRPAPAAQPALIGETGGCL